MKHIFAFLSLLFIPVLLHAETVLEHLYSDDLYHATNAFVEHKLDIEAAQAICRRMLSIAKSRDIEIVINSKFINEKNYKPTMTSCDTSSVNFAMFIALEVANQLNIKAKEYDCNLWGKINLADNNISHYLFDMFMYDAFQKVGDADITCSDEEDRCVVNQVITDGKGTGVYVFCLKIYDYEYSTTPDGLCVHKASHVSHEFENILYNSKSLNDFDKDCNPLFKE